MIVNADPWEAPLFSDVNAGGSVFAIDPGETTGWCELQLDARARPSLPWRVSRFGQVNCWECLEESGSVLHAEAAAVSTLVRLIGACPTVVAEDFTLRAGTKTRNLLSPVRLTSGLFLWLSKDSYEHRFYLQSPSDAKSAVTDERLREAGMWFSGEQHARDAARHALLLLRRRR